MGDKVLSSKKSTRLGKESYLKIRCSVRNSLQLLEQCNRIKTIDRNSDNNGITKHDNGSLKPHTNEEPQDTNYSKDVG
jgi:hypothetical protein